MLAGLVAGLAIAELGLRLVPPPTRKQHIVPDPVLHHRLRPGVTAEIQSTPYATNTLGLRDREVAIPKPAGTFRILMLGDSFTEGAGLALEDTVAKQVERRLTARGCRGHEVINAGLQSYSPILEYLLLRHVGLRLEPDLVILNFDMTDVHDDLVRTAIAVLDPDGLPVRVPADRRAETAVLLPRTPKPAALRFLDPVEARVHRLAVYQAFRRSDVGEWLLGPLRLGPEQFESLGLAGDVRYDALAITRDGEGRGVEAAWRLSERYVRATRDLARRHGAPFVLVTYPHPHQVSATESPLGRRRFGIGPGLYASRRPFERLEALGRAEGFPVITLLGLFRARAATDGPLFRHDDIHHTAAGARVFGEGIVAGLLERRLLERCR